MKHVFLTLYALLAALQAAGTTDSASSEAVWIARFKGDRAAAVSITLDDGLRNQDDVAVPLLNEHGIKATFFVIPGLTQSITETGVSFTLECALDQAQFHDPLTVVIPVKDAANATAKRRKSGAPLPVEVLKDRILIQAEPSVAPVEVTWIKEGTRQEDR